jgi:hypothetical protein
MALLTAENCWLIARIRNELFPDEHQRAAVRHRLSRLIKNVKMQATNFSYE